jgi:hypothetical protein
MNNDFIEYWAAARLLVTGGNPYSPVELFEVQRALGWSQHEPLIMWNPPWTLFFTAPLGLLDYGTAQFVWVMLHVVTISVGARMLWQTYGGSLQRSWWALFVVLTFAPTYLVLLMGQIGPLILLGLIIFLQTVNRRSWSIAGLSLSLVSIKPHLLYLFWLALVVWLLRGRRWKFLGGWIIGAIITGLAPLFVDPAIYSRYVELLKNADVIRPFQYATPSLGLALGKLLSVEDDWLRWTPSVLGAIWALSYWRKKAARWEWNDQLPIILLVSVATTSFVWSFDHIVLLPAVIQGAVWLSRSPSLTLSRSLIVLHIVLNMGIMMLRVPVPSDFWYFWVAPIYLIFYLYARSILRPAAAAS